MKQSRRIRARCRLSLEALELRLPPGAILSTDDCAVNVLLSLRERTAGPPLAERDEYIGRAVCNSNGLNLTSFDLDLLTRAEALPGLQLSGSLTSAEFSTPSLSISGDDEHPATLQMAGGNVNQVSERTESATELFLMVQETMTSFRPGTLDGGSQMVMSSDSGPMGRGMGASAEWFTRSYALTALDQSPTSFTRDPVRLSEWLAQELTSNTRSLAVSEQAPLAFDPASGWLAIWGHGDGDRINETMTPGGFLEVTLGNQRHSSDPVSGWFDQALAGASRETLAGIRVEGSSGQVPLALASQTLARGLTVQTDGPVDVTGAVQGQGPVAITAATITVHGTLRGTTVSLASPRLVNVAATGSVAADRIAVTAGVFINAGQLHADGIHGGQLSIQAGNMLQGGRISADGTTANGGTVQVGFQGSYIATAAALTSADGVSGGQITIDGGATGRLFSSGTQQALGRSATGGAVSLDGGDIILVGGTADASGQVGGGTVTIGSSLPARSVTANAATLRGRVIIGNTFGASAPTSGFHLIDPHPTRTGTFGFTITPLSNGNLVVTNPHDNFVAPDSGAVYLFQGRTGALLGTLVGSAAGDRLGDTESSFDIGPVNSEPTGLTIPHLTSNTYQVDNDPASPGPTGPIGDRVLPLTNGNYLVVSPRWNGNRGAVTWGDGTMGITGTVDVSNSLVGTKSGDRVGAGNGDLLIDGTTALPNGNYVVLSPNWNGNRGAATWGNGAIGITGFVDASNSLVGSNPGNTCSQFNPGDCVSYGGITSLSNGNYVVASPNWNNKRGAATWGDGTIGINGTLDTSNSLIGSNANDAVGFRGVTALTNGNYVVISPFWNGHGAVTWGNGKVGITGAVDEGNSLTGNGVGYGVTPLSNGNYVVASPFWNGYLGAATWGNGSTGVSGVVDAKNSLVGSHFRDQIGTYVKPLTNGNYVVGSPVWNGNTGSATWGDGTIGVNGTVDASNSLIGSSLNDCVGRFVVGLTNGNYVVSSIWSRDRGAATWGNGKIGITGTVNPSNSLVGTYEADDVASVVTALSNGNYVVGSKFWRGYNGAATWGNGTVGITGPVDVKNSLVGNANDEVGYFVTALSNGNYVVGSPYWRALRGAATWGNGTSGMIGEVGSDNSLIGGSPNDELTLFGISALSNGNYVAISPYWNGHRGAASWGDGTIGITGTVDVGNSLTGSNTNDAVGFRGVTALSNGNYVVASPNWNSYRGAATWGDGTIGITGTVDAGNSLVGSNVGDQVGFGRVYPLSNGDYVVGSPDWNGNRGAVTWGDGTVGITGEVDGNNSLVG